MAGLTVLAAVGELPGLAVWAGSACLFVGVQAWRHSGWVWAMEVTQEQIRTRSLRRRWTTYPLSDIDVVSTSGSGGAAIVIAGRRFRVADRVWRRDQSARIDAFLEGLDAAKT